MRVGTHTILSILLLLTMALYPQGVSSKRLAKSGIDTVRGVQVVGFTQRGVVLRAADARDLKSGTKRMYFSGSYKDWGTIKCDGKQLQVGALFPAIVQRTDGTVQVLESGSYRDPTIRFWMAAGPILVRNGKPVSLKEIRHRHPTLNIDGKTKRVVLAINDREVAFIYFQHHSLQEVSRQTYRRYKTVVNLDGGSAAVFRSRGRPSARFLIEAVLIQTPNQGS